MNRLIILILISFNFCIGQNTLLNEAKYWVWRDRLVNDFMVPNYTGDYSAKGRGIIFDKRGDGWFQDFNYVNWRNDSEYTIDSITSYSGGFDIGDEGFDMGKYLIVLASEWRLLFNSGLPTQQTEAEIFWALKTIDRLDYDAETYWSYFWSRGQECWGGQLNGFMIRDDVFTNFLWYSPVYPTETNGLNDEYFNYFKQWYNGIVPPYLKFNQTAYENYRYLNQGPGGNVGKYIQQNIMLCNPAKDTIYDLLELMDKHRKRLNDKGFPYSQGFSGATANIFACYDIRSPADNYPIRHDRSGFRSHHWTGPREYSQDNYIGLLQGLVAVQQLVNSNVNVNGYGLHSYAAHLIDRIIYSIKKNNSYNNNWEIDNPVTKECVKGVFWDEYISSSFFGYIMKPWCNLGGAQAHFFSYNFCLIHELYTSSCSNCHQSGCQHFYSGDIGFFPINTLQPTAEQNRDEVAILATLTADLPNSKCCIKINNCEGEKKFKFIYLDLLYCILHNENPYRDIESYYYILDTTSCYNQNSYYSNLLTQMIIHNLLKLLKGEKYQYHIIDHNTYPSATTFCTQSQVTFGSIESDATITKSPTSGCKANVTYKAGKEIHLKPGFKVINGAKFHGYIGQMDVCQVKEGNPEVAVLFFPPSDEHLSPYVSNLNYTREEIIENNNEPKETVLNNAILLYPNPAKDMLTLLSDRSVSYNVEIYDNMGQLIERGEVNANENISVCHLKRGFYIFKIFDQNQLVQIQKIVLQ